MDRAAVASPFRPNAVTGIIDGRFYANCAIARIFYALCEHPYGLTREELVDIIYGDDPDGGPLAAGNCISVNVWRFNVLARRHRIGLRIGMRKGDKRMRRGGGKGVRRCLWVVRE